MKEIELIILPPKDNEAKNKGFEIAKIFSESETAKKAGLSGLR